MKRFVVLACTILFALFPSLNAEDINSSKQKNLEFGLMVNGFIEGSEGDELQSSGAVGVRGGYFFTPQWSLSSELMFANNVGFNNAEGSTDIYRFLISGNWYHQTSESSRAFLSAGTGYESFPEFSPKNGMVGTVGLGVAYLFTDAYNVSIEAKYKTNLDHKDIAVLISLALNYRFGLSD